LPETLQFPPLSNTELFGGTGVNSTSTSPSQNALTAEWLPSSGTSIETLISDVATGGATNTCHVVIAVIPTG
jgi:hypothetical protein